MPNIELIVGSLGVVIALGSLWYAHRAVDIANRGNLLESQKWFRDRSAQLWMVEPLTGINYGESTNETLRYQVAFRNEGLSAATDFNAALFFHQTGFRSNGTSASHAIDDRTGEMTEIVFPLVMPVGAIWVFRFQVRKSDFGEADPRKISILLSWRDDLGERKARWGMVYTGELNPGSFGGASPAEVLVDGRAIRPRNSMLEELVSVNPHHEYVD